MLQQTMYAVSSDTIFRHLGKAYSAHCTEDLSRMTATGKYEAAAAAYSTAITMAEVSGTAETDTALLYCNRSAAYIRLGQFFAVSSLFLRKISAVDMWHPSHILTDSRATRHAAVSKQQTVYNAAAGHAGCQKVHRAQQKHDQGILSIDSGAASIGQVQGCCGQCQSWRAPAQHQSKQNNRLQYAPRSDRCCWCTSRRLCSL